MRVFRMWIPKGDFGTSLVVMAMRFLARGGVSKPLIRGLALEAIQGTEGKDGTAQAVAIRDFIDANVEFVRDPAGEELLYTPDRMARILTGGGGPLRIDCDDVAVLAAALGGSVGLRSRFVVVGFLSPKAPFRHVWAELASPGRHAPWVEQDVTRQQQSLPIADAIARRWIVGVT